MIALYIFGYLVLGALSSWLLNNVCDEVFETPVILALLFWPSLWLAFLIVKAFTPFKTLFRFLEKWLGNRR